MNRRPGLVPLLALLAASFPGFASAGSIVNTYNYRLTDNDPAGSAPITGVTLLVTPGGTQANPTVMPSDPSQSPLTIASNSTGFTGQVQVGSGAVALPSGVNNEVINLVFTNGGLQPGGVVNFSLEENPSIGMDPATLSIFFPTTAKLSIVSLSKPSNTNLTLGGGSTGLVVFTPEPISFLVWGVIGSLGMARAGIYRSRRQTVFA